MSINDVYLQANAEQTLRDYKHASKLFRDDAFRFLPKQQNLFHVAIDFSREIGFGETVAAESEIGFGETVAAEKIEAGLLVKAVDLPSYTIKNKINNAYNRKNLIQSQIEYGDVRIVFHDDSANLTNAMWQAYYEYYYADSYGEPVEYRIDTKYNDRNRLNWGFVPPSKPFFQSIRIYTLSQKKFTGYTLINPLITRWNHGRHAVDADSPMENEMSIIFEAVLYSHGVIGEDEEPKFFTDQHYDNEISPLGLGAGSEPPPSVESSGATIRSNVSLLDQFSDGNWEGGVGSLIDGIISGDGDKIKDQLTSTTRNVLGAVASGDNITDVYNFPAPIAGPLQNVQDILQPARAVRVATGQAEPGTRDVARSNGSDITSILDDLF
jgi:hypothetical protein